jgi:hypothetical protein
MIKHLSSQQWELLKILDRESTPIKVVARLLQQGHRIVFAPDYSEINSYISPYRDITAGDMDQNIRYWYSIKVLLESSDFPVIMLPPYLAELSRYVRILRNHPNDPNQVLESIQTLLEDEKFAAYFDSLPESTDILNLDDVVSVISTRGRELGILHELMSRHEKIQMIEDLWSKGRLKRSYDVLQDIDDEAILRNSIDWQRKVHEIRSKKSDKEKSRIDISSHFDGWAIEYIRAANALAEQNPGKYPFVIFITRSGDIRKIVDGALSIRLHQAGRLDTLWNPDTCFAYQLISNSVSQNYSEMINTVDEIYQLIKAYNQGNMPEEMQVNAVRFLESIENLNLYYGNIEDFENHRLIDIKKLSNYSNLQQIRLVGKIVDFVKKNNVDEILERMDIEILSLWKKFASSLPTVSSKRIDGKSYVTIKIPGHRVWVSIHSPSIIKIFDAVESIFEATEVFRKQKASLSGSNAAAELLLVEALLSIGTEKWTRLDEILKQLDTNNDFHIQKEVCLLRLSRAFLLGSKAKDLEEDISDCDASHNPLDPRLPRILSLLKWRKYELKQKEDELRQATEYAKQAFELASADKSSEYYGECLNNFAYFQLLIFQKDASALSLSELSMLYNELKAFYSEQIESPFYPVEIIHTLGILQSNLAWYSETMSIADKIAMLNEAIKDLLLATRLDHENELFISDFSDAEQKLQELKKQVA